MARRVRLPAADDLFRPTIDSDSDSDSAVGTAAGTAVAKPRSSVRVVPDVETDPDPAEAETAGPGAAGSEPVDEPVAGTEPAGKRASGRVRHDEKMTVYVTAEELLDIERTRLELRGAHGLAVDRGRLVREAIDVVLADFGSEGEASMLVRRLREG